MGSEIAQLAHTELVAPINRAMFPGYARLVNEPDMFRRVCAEATSAILIVVLPASFAVAVFAQPIVRILLGEQWRAAAPVVQILAFAGGVSAITSNNMSAYLALGRPQLSTLILGARLALFATMIFAFARGRGVTAVAYCELTAALGSLLVSLPILFRAVELKMAEYFSGAWRPLLASSFTAAALHVVLRLGDGAQTLATALGQVLLGLPMGLMLYVSTLWMLWRISGRPASVDSAIGRRVLYTIGDSLSRAWKRTG